MVEELLTIALEALEEWAKANKGTANILMFLMFLCSIIAGLVLLGIGI